MLDKSRIKMLVHYALLSAAGEDDPTRRSLGEIHLLKYLYIADKTHAQWHKGQTFTGGDWMFHKFGPWSQAIYALMVACLAELNAEERHFPSRFGQDDCKRWSIEFDENELREIKTALPLDVKQSVSDAVHRHGNDTASLLEEVYASEPMLQAAPGEPLQFQSLQTHQTQVSGEVFVPFLEKLSQADRLRFRKARREAASRISDHLARTPAPPSFQPPADSDYGNILSWLEGLAGPKLITDTELEFSHSIWKSSSRRGGEA